MKLPKIRPARIIPSIFLSGFLLISCNNTNDGKKTLDFGRFTIEVPSTWNKVKLRGIDSYVGLIAIGETDTLTFDLGWYSSSLQESPPFTDTAIYAVIDNRKAKIVRPIRSGTGITGVYFDSVWVAGSDNDRFQISGRNLKSENERLVLEAIQTLRFKNE